MINFSGIRDRAVSVLTLLFICATTAVTPPAQAQPAARPDSALPTLGDTSEMTSAAERKLGERIARELYRDPDYIDDPVLNEYVQGIWQPLLAAARARGELTAELDERFAWQVLLGKDRTINAFALPGGWLGLHLGLVSVTTSRDELASVLAHELSHVTQRHIARLVSQEKRQTPWVIGAMILGALAASKNADAGNAVMAGGQALAAQNQLNFSRDMEREADRIGFGVLTQAGFEPQGFVAMFERLQQASRLNDNGAYPYLRTHPMTTERMADMQSRQQLVPRSTPPNAGLEQPLMSARARVLSNLAVDALRSHLTEADAVPATAAPARRAAVFYAASLASARLRDASGAARYLARLEAVTNSDAKGKRLTRLLGAELALLANDPRRAVGVLDGTSSTRPEVLLWSQAKIQAGAPGEAIQRLQSWVALQPRDGTAWQMLGTAYGAQGQTLRAIRAEAEAQVAWLDYAAAVDRFKAAQDLVRRGAAGGDHIEASIIDTRARAVESLLREQALER